MFVRVAVVVPEVVELQENIVVVRNMVFEVDRDVLAPLVPRFEVVVELEEGMQVELLPVEGWLEVKMDGLELVQGLEVP